MISPRSPGGASIEPRGRESSLLRRSDLRSARICNIFVEFVENEPALCQQVTQRRRGFSRRYRHREESTAAWLPRLTFVKMLRSHRIWFRPALKGQPSSYGTAAPRCVSEKRFPTCSHFRRHDLPPRSVVWHCRWPPRPG